MKVSIITATQAQQLKTTKFDGVQFFNPVQDAAGNWVITRAEITQCIVPQLTWVRALAENLIDFTPPEKNINI